MSGVAGAVPSVATAAEIALTRAEWQPVVFAEKPRRLELQRLRRAWPLRPVRVTILRNHNVEQAIPSLQTFLAYAGLSAEVQLSGYSDSLDLPPAAEADVHVAWPDFTRYDGLGRDELAAWTTSRIETLRRQVRGPLLILGPLPAVAGAEALEAALKACVHRLADSHVLALTELADLLHGGGVDTRAAALGTAVSGEAALVIAQMLGLRWIPALTAPRLKAVVLDLDNTLVGGVLGEDGAAGLQVEDDHHRLHRRLAELSADGLLLALASKNDLRDVESLLTSDGPLRLLDGHFVTLEVGWHDKAASIRRIADRMRIGSDSILFVDDNASEIAAVAAALPGIWTLLAITPAATERALALYPGLLTTRRDVTATLRRTDLIAAGHRDEASNSAADPLEYMASLRVSITFRLDDPADRQRVSELCCKTNQFNTTLLRLSESEVETYIVDPLRHLVTVNVRDRLSDSGLIGAILTHSEGDDLMVDVIALSCRALGRSLESLFILEPLRVLVDLLDPQRVIIPTVEGPRNGPALDWLSRLPASDRDAGAVVPSTAVIEIAARVRSLPVEVAWAGRESG